MDPERNADERGILIVDDDASIRFAMADYFAAKGFRSKGVESRVDAELQLCDGNYAVVITDLRLTPHDDAEGLEIVRLVAQRHPGVDCIVLTAYGSPANEETAARYGASAFLNKPQPMGEVLGIVNALLAAAAERTATAEAVDAPQTGTAAAGTKPARTAPSFIENRPMIYQAPDEVVDQIWHDLAEQVERARVAEVVRDVAAEIGEVKVATFVPLFVRRISVERLTPEASRSDE